VLAAGLAQQILDVLELEQGSAQPGLAEGLDGHAAFYTDLCHVQTARAAGEVGDLCAELVYGYNRHPAMGRRQAAATRTMIDLEQLERMPGRGPGCSRELRAEAAPAKAGPCAASRGRRRFASCGSTSSTAA
jgi:hypothetical protein